MSYISWLDISRGGLKPEKYQQVGKPEKYQQVGKPEKYQQVGNQTNISMSLPSPVRFSDKKFQRTSTFTITTTTILMMIVVIIILSFCYGCLCYH